MPYTLQPDDSRQALFDAVASGSSSFVSPKNSDGSSLQVMSVNSNSAGNITATGTIDCTGKNVVVFDANVIVQINGAGGLFELIAQKELGVANINTLNVTGTANYLLS